jgi:hypothetical protein
MIIREEIFIAAPPEAVWRVFADIGNWGQWNPVCRECRLESGQALAAGACISFQLRPVFFPVRIRPVITRCRPAREVVWSGSKWGLHAEHTFLFKPENGGTRLESIERFSGWMLPLLKAAGIPRRLHQLTRELLATLQSRAENRSEPENS